MPACGGRFGRKLPCPPARPPHRRQSLRLGPARPQARRDLRHRNDRPQSPPSRPHPGRETPASLSPPLEGRTALRLAAPLPPPRHPMGVPHRKLPRLRPPRLPSPPPSVFMRPALVRLGHRDLLTALRLNDHARDVPLVLVGK